MRKFYFFLFCGLMCAAMGVKAQPYTDTYDITSGAVTIPGSPATGGNYLINGGTSTNSIVVPNGLNVTITLQGVNITSSTCAFEIRGTSTVKLILDGTNTLTSGSYYAGLAVPSGATLVIDGTGKLTATGGTSSTNNTGGGAGIGGNGSNGAGGNSGSISITNATIETTGGNGYGNNAGGGAGIGGGGGGNNGAGGSSGNISIKNCTIDVKGGNAGGNNAGGGAGIGGGGGGNNRGGGAYGTISIIGGSGTSAGGTASGGGGGAGIGGGGGGSGQAGGVGNSGNGITYNSPITGQGGTGGGGTGASVGYGGGTGGSSGITYTISVSALASFGSLAAPYTQPTDQTVTITNTGTGAITLIPPTATNYDIGTLSTDALAVGGTATFTVQPKAGLGAGNYDEIITITSTNGTGTIINASFTVTDSYSISATPSIDFGSLTASYAQPAAQTVTITNTGVGAITLTQPVSTDYSISTLSKATIAAGEEATFTVRPVAGLGIGNYDESITISGSNSTSATVSVTFTVTDSYSISASPPTLTFSTLQTPYTQPAVQTVTITNTGTGSITLTQPTSTDYSIGTLSKTTIAAGEEATFTVRPVAGLGIGNYDESITISGSNSTSATVSVTFTVTDSYSISASPPTLTFATLQTPYTQPAAQTVTITNTGTGPITLTQPTSTDYSIGALSKTTIAAGEEATFTVRPKAGLGVGNHNESITISGSNSTSATVSVTFTVTGSYSISASPSSLTFGTFQTPYTQPAAQTVTITNDGAGSMTLLQPFSTDYIIGTLSKATIAPGEEATFTVQPHTGLGIGNYPEQITINSDIGAKAVLDVFFTVSAIPVVLVSSITVSGAGSATSITTHGGTLQMSATLLPANATNTSVVWTVENGTGSATISSTGLLTATGNGTVTVVATAVDGSGTTDQVTITINGQPGAPMVIGPTFLRLAEGYQATNTEPFFISGSMPITVTKISGNAKIQWDDLSHRLTIDEGLTKDSYPVVLRASNGVSPDATFTFTLEVGEPIYRVYFNSFSGGTITANVLNIATAGETVTLTITPNTNYALNNINIFRYDNQSVVVPFSGTANTCTFTMPAYDIIVVASFREIRTGIEDAQQTGVLKGYVRNGILYVSGLTEGKTWSVFNTSGKLVYQAIATNDKAEIMLPGRGVFIVTDGEETVGVVR